MSFNAIKKIKIKKCRRAVRRTSRYSSYFTFYVELHQVVHKTSGRYSGYDAHDCEQLACVLYIYCSYQAQSLCLSVFLFRYLFDLIFLEKHKRVYKRRRQKQPIVTSCIQLAMHTAEMFTGVSVKSDKHVWS